MESTFEFRYFVCCMYKYFIVENWIILQGRYTILFRRYTILYCMLYQSSVGDPERFDCSSESGSHFSCWCGSRVQLWREGKRKKWVMHCRVQLWKEGKGKNELCTVEFSYERKGRGKNELCTVEFSYEEKNKNELCTRVKLWKEGEEMSYALEFSYKGKEKKWVMHCRVQLWREGNGKKWVMHQS